MLDGIANQPGTYLLVFHADGQFVHNVGRLGMISLQVGYYFYIGSAFGPGGVRARVRHHFNISTKPHWHIDYIRPALTLKEIWYSTDLIRYEHDWADSLYYTMQMLMPLAGFGASDCKCESHFYYAASRPEQAEMLEALKKNISIMNLTIVNLS